MPVLHEPMNLGDLLKYEAPNLYSRDEVVVAAGQTLALGAVVGRISATGEVVALDPTASDGREAVAGVLLEAVTVARGDARRRSVIVARHAIVFGGALVMPASLTPEQTATAIAQLAALGVLVRQFPHTADPDAQPVR